MLIAGVVSLIGRPISQFLSEKVKLNSILASTISIIFLLGILFLFISIQIFVTIVTIFFIEMNKKDINE